MSDDRELCAMQFELTKAQEQCERLKAEVIELRERLDNAGRELVAHREKAQGNYWAWDGTGENHPESLVCPVLISAHQMRELVSELATANSALTMQKCHFEELDETQQKLKAAEAKLAEKHAALNEAVERARRADYFRTQVEDQCEYLKSERENDRDKIAQYEARLVKYQSELERMTKARDTLDAAIQDPQTGLAALRAELERVTEQMRGSLAASERAFQAKLAEANAEITRLKAFHIEDMRVTNKSADYHIKANTVLIGKLAEAERQRDGLREALEKVHGFGKDDLTAGELSDYVNEVCSEALSTPTTPPKGEAP